MPKQYAVNLSPDERESLEHLYPCKTFMTNH